MLKVTLLTKTVGKYKNVYISNSTKAGRCEELKQRKKILQLARECVEMSEKVRPEVTWLSEVYDRYRKRNGIRKKADADILISQRMHGVSAPLKVRYWRTGKHIPLNREQCQKLGMALELEKKEMEILFQRYYDRADRIWQDEPDAEDKVYRERRERMEALQKEYLIKIDPDRFLHRSVTHGKQKENFRHLYYVDAGRYTLLGDRSDYLERAASMSYHTELKRIMLLFGEILRKTMIRHMIILCAPNLSVERLNENLEAFGYQPLDETHTQIDGTYLDWLLIRILKIYADCCSGKNPEECILWLQKCFRILDQFFADQRMTGLRLMHFKTLER